MNLCKFLNFNKFCPICEEPLTLFLQVSEGPLWKSTVPSPGVYDFRQIKCASTELPPESYIRLIDQEETVGVQFNHKGVMDKFKDWSFLLYFMCNQNGITDRPYSSFIINPYIACYIRSSPYMKFLSNDKNEWELIRSKDEMEHDEEAVFELPADQTKDEICIFKVQGDDLEKVYALNFDYQAAQTVLRYYATTAKERQIEDFEPKVFKKELPLLGVRPNFEVSQRAELISRLDSWILMS